VEKSEGCQEEEIGRVTAVCISEKKGRRKVPVPAITLRAGYGVVGDAHGGSERQVSLLSQESIEKMRRLGVEAGEGDFAENITIFGAALHLLPIGSVLRIGDKVRLRVTQIGKECHSACEIRTITGCCIMPEEGVFAEVLQGGEVKAGDEVRLERLLQVCPAHP